MGLREIGKIRRTLHIARWIMNPEQRRITTEGLNKGEARNALADAIVIHRQGEIRDRSLEDQQHRASALNLVTALIVLWNTVYMQKIVDYLRQTGYPLTDDLIGHLSPLKWSHINLTGHYIWKPSTNQKGELRLLRNQPKSS